MKLRKYLRRHELRHAEWNDKVIYFANGDSCQHWSLSILLPVPIGAKNKSQRAALKRYLKQVRKL